MIIKSDMANKQFFYLCLYINAEVFHDTFAVYLAGFTYQYHQLNAYMGEDSHLRVMGFPCNQFGHQEPADNATELFNGLKYVRPGSGFVPAFDIMGIGDVNGEKESFVYTYLKV